MPKYEVRLESPTGSQSRIIELDRPSETEARADVEAQEHDLACFSLLPPEKDVWEVGGPRAAALNVSDGDAVVDLSRWDAHDPKFTQSLPDDDYSEHKRAAKARLQDWSGRVDIANNGKVRYANLGPRSKARFLAHQQSEPYQIVSVEEVAEQEIEAQRLVRQLAALQSNPAQWERVLEEMRAQGIPLAAVTAFLYGLPWEKQINGSSVTVFSSATVKMMLLTGRTAVQDTDDFINDAATEITGTGYTAGGYTFAAKTSTYDTASDQIRLDNTTDPSWTTSTLSATDAEVWVDTAGASSTDPLYANIDFGATVTTTAGTFQVTLDATGWAVFDVT